MANFHLTYPPQDFYLIVPIISRLTNHKVYDIVLILNTVYSTKYMPDRNTKNNILTLIKQNPGIRTKEILRANSPLTDVMVFRHLKNLTESGQIFKIGSTPKVKYYYQLNMEDKTKLEQQFFNWALTGDGQYATKDLSCLTRDVFQARYEKLLANLKNIVSENLLYLLVGTVAEIGNNSFDHNLGNWRDVPGVLFAANTDAREIILSDRGQGVLSTIRRVRPQTADDAAALCTAFTEIISGRAPEQRGNGLKYAKKVITENNLYLEFHSGEAVAKITGQNFTIEKSAFNIPGTLVIIKF